MKHQTPWDTRVGRSSESGVLILVATVVAVLALPVILFILYNVSGAQERDSARIAVSAEKVSGFTQGVEEFAHDTHRIYVYVRSPELGAELSVERRGLTSIVSALGGEEEIVVGDGERAGQAVRFELTASPGGQLPPGRYTIRLSGEGETEVFFVRRW